MKASGRQTKHLPAEKATGRQKNRDTAATAADVSTHAVFGKHAANCRISVTSACPDGG